MENKMKSIEDILSENQFIIKQERELLEALTGFETKNKYSILDKQNDKIGFIAEQGSGFIALLKRFFLRNHAPFDISVFNLERNEVLQLHRPFFWFFSDLIVSFKDKNNNVTKYGSIHRKFSIFSKRYSILNSHGKEVFKIQSAFWKIWKFPIFDTMERPMGFITKKWQGLVSEIFTDKDSYLIQLESPDLTPEDKVLLFASGISIDFDFFENNQGRSGLFSFFDN